ncbi:MAG: ABC transporter ATP-binding protein [Planctomycetes bacterium]|nr:ABC transporter ATP-binding protein [Planctomycetota bacterium]
MHCFRRVLFYVKLQYKSVLLLVFCALLVAMLFSMSLAAMLPLMKVMMDEEGLHGWIHRTIIKDRSGVSFNAVPVDEFLSDQVSAAQQDKLQVSSVKLDSPGFEILMELDEIVDVIIGDEHSLDRNKQLEILAHAQAGESIELKVIRGEGNELTVYLTMEDPFVYRQYVGPATWLLERLPQSQGAEFKRKCIILIIIIMLTATLMRCALRFTQEYLAKKIGFRTMMYVRMNTFKHVIRLPLSHFSTEGVSDTLSRFVKDSNNVLTGINTLLGKAIREPLTMLTLATLAFIINPKMTLIVVTGAPVAGLMLGRLGKKMKKATRRTLENWSRLLSVIRESLQGIRVVKGYHRETFEEDNFQRTHKRLLKQQFRMAKIDAASGPLLEALGMIAACVAMILAAYWLTDPKSKMPVSEFTTLVLLLGAMAESGRKMGNVYPRLQNANAAAERIYKLVDTPGEVDPPNAAELQPLAKSLEFKNITFSYPNTNQPALSDVNLTVKAGETIALVGPNGSGKTTLLSIIPRFFIPDEGAILIDGQNTADVTLGSLRRQIGIVTQQTIVFNDTIAANIAYGNPDETEENIIAASKQAFAHEFIEQTAQGYQTIVGEQGATLSGGQLQRIAIARAILRDPAILIFDEAMSQIDSESEAKIQQTLLEFSRDRTSFIIAHRLSTIVNSDRIVVLDQGKIIAIGNHQELMETCKLYRQLYEVQFVSDEPDNN